MIVLKRKRGEALVIGQGLVVRLIGADGQQAVLRMEAGELTIVAKVPLEESLAVEWRGTRVRVQVVKPLGFDFYLGVEAPADVLVLREELVRQRSLKGEHGEKNQAAA